MKGLKVRHHDSVVTYLVASETRPEIEHLVDVTAWNGIGGCSCEHFTMRIEPELSRGGRPLDNRCKHILAAREMFCDRMIQELTKNERKIRDGRQQPG